MIESTETALRKARKPGAPRHRDVHCFESEAGHFFLLVDGSRVFRANAALHNRLAEGADETVQNELQRLGFSGVPAVAAASSGTPPPVHALSLAVAQKCNLGCTYCYAQEGAFGGRAQNMPTQVAMEAVDLLFRDVQPGGKVSLSFLGGEPLFNRPVIHAATEYAAALAKARGARVQFAITTNATLMEPGDADFLERHGFAVTVSLDGVGEVHDRQRAFKGGAGSYQRILERVKPLLENQRRMQVSARVTVTPDNPELVEALEAFLALGFHSVGFSPLLHSPTGRGLMHVNDLERMLEQMMECGRRFENAIFERRRYAFANMVNAMREIHAGTHRPYPCGAGAGYFGVSAEGGLFACHRFVNDEAGEFGDLSTGINRERQAAWLGSRHVDWQEPCRSCWARYLCGGGCHHEVIHRGREACDFIRGWLHYCLQAYTRLLAARPDYFAPE